MESAAFLPSALQQPQHKNPRSGSSGISFAKKEKIQATLIHPEKKKFPCSAETGDAGRHHPRRRPDEMPEAGGQMFVPSQSSLLGSSALSPVSTEARANTSRLRAAWPGSGSAAGVRVAQPEPAAPWTQGLEKRGRRESKLLRPDPSPFCSERRLQPPVRKCCRMERGSASLWLLRATRLLSGLAVSAEGHAAPPRFPWGHLHKP
jgi:hypothetical protein